MVTFSGQGCLGLAFGVEELPKKFIKKVGNPLDSRFSIIYIYSAQMNRCSFRAFNRKATPFQACRRLEGR